MAQAVARPGIPFAVGLEVELSEQRIEQFALDRWKHQLVRLLTMARHHPLEWYDRARHRLAISGTALAAHGNVQNAVSAFAIDDGLAVANLDAFGFIGREPLLTRKST